MEFPKIKKKVNAFLLSEDGKISKKNVITVTAAIAMISLSAENVLGDSNAQNTLTIDGDNAELTNTEHSSHGSHGSGCSAVTW